MIFQNGVCVCRRRFEVIYAFQAYDIWLRHMIYAHAGVFELVKYEPAQPVHVKYTKAKWLWYMKCGRCPHEIFIMR